MQTQEGKGDDGSDGEEVQELELDHAEKELRRELSNANIVVALTDPLVRDAVMLSYDPKELYLLLREIRDRNLFRLNN
jgi:hypothetical protein